MKEETYKNIMGYLHLSALVKLLLSFTIPLILVYGFVSFNGGPNISYWPSKHHHLFSSWEKYHVTTKDLRSKVDGVRNEEVNSLTVDYALSPTPPRLATQAADDLPLGNEISNPADVVATISDETHATTDLNNLEIGLQKARAAIKEAKYTNRTYDDPDFNPVGPAYWNANSFHRSYLEMEKRFKVYVYEDGEPPLFHTGPCAAAYSTEGNFINLMEINDEFRTKNPNKAHVFFLPFSVTNMVSFLFHKGPTWDLSFLTHVVTDYTNIISSKYPYWNRSLAADHFMLSCHDWGPIASKTVPYLKTNSIRVLCNANTSEGFQPWKDVSLPEINIRTWGEIDEQMGGNSPSNRSILAFFAGGKHGPVRPALIDYWGNKSDEDMRIHTYLPKNVSYYDLLRNSKFCICPSGYEVASARVVEAIYTGCIPVLMSDHYVPPFSDVLNWKSFSIEVPVKEIPNLKTILLSVSKSQYLNKYKRVLQVRKHFEVRSPPQRYDFFHMILHSVWLRRLNVNIHDHKQL